MSLTKLQKAFIRKNHDEMTLHELCRKLGASTKEVGAFMKDKNLKIKKLIRKKVYRREITFTTRFLLCISDFEGYTHEELCDLFAINPKCIGRMLKAMQQSGEYKLHLSVFAEKNEGAYLKAKKRRENNLELARGDFQARHKATKYIYMTASGNFSVNIGAVYLGTCKTLEEAMNVRDKYMELGRGQDDNKGLVEPGERITAGN